jgi:filamentous hemagglutinin
VYKESSAPLNLKGLTNLTRAQAIAAEQALIEHYGSIKNGGALLNKINIIAASNPAYGSALGIGKMILSAAGHLY